MLDCKGDPQQNRSDPRLPACKVLLMFHQKPDGKQSRQYGKIVKLVVKTADVHSQRRKQKNQGGGPIAETPQNARSTDVDNAQK